MNTKLFIFSFLILLISANAEELYCKQDGVWPDTAAGKNRTISCTLGYLERSCNYIGENEVAWGEIMDNDCKCGRTIDVPVDIEVKPNEIATVDCMSGAIVVPCNATGWYNYNTVDFNTCKCTSEGLFNEIETEYTQTATCLYGEATRYCNWGHWDLADYNNCFNQLYNCTEENYKTGDFLIKPDFSDRTEYDEEVSIQLCIYAVEYYSKEPVPSVDTILNYGECTMVSNSTLPVYINDYEFERSGYYYLYVFAHRDMTPVPIPALPLREDKQTYVALVRTAACILSPHYVESDSESITIEFHSTWPFYGEPVLSIYYSDDPEKNPYNSVLPVVTKDISTEDYYYYVYIDAITSLKNNTEYYFYMISRDNVNQTDFSMMDTFITGHTYDYCVGTVENGLIDYGIIGVDKTAEVACTIGEVGRLCLRAENWTAIYGEEINNCYCESTIIHEHPLDETKYHDSYPIECGGGPATVPCNFKGIWGDFDGCTCGNDDDIWIGDDRNKTEVFFCDDGSLIRECKISGFWGEVTNIHCYCSYETYWPPVPSSSTYVKSCPIGERSRECDKFGQWGEADISNCACAALNQWPSTPADTTVSLSCPVGNRKRTCDVSGSWGSVDTTGCFCAADDIWPQTQAGTTASTQCGSGSITRFCNIDGTWATAVSNECMCAESLIWPATPAGTVASVPCTNGASSSMTRLCNSQGQWEATSNTDECFEVCEQKGKFYPAPIGETVTVMCPNNIAFVEMECKRSSTSGPVWGDYQVFGDCSCPYDGIWGPVAVGETSVITCDIGYKVRYCNPYTTSWDNEIDYGCQCAAQDRLPVTNSGTSVIIGCGSGSKHASCEDNGVWGEIDISTCGCAPSDIYGSATANTDKVAVCPEDGYRTIHCDENGDWTNEDTSTCLCDVPDLFKAIWATGLPLGGSYTNQCSAEGTSYSVECSSLGVTNVITNTCSCAADTSLKLNITAAGETYTQKCGFGRISATCNALGIWTSYVNTCQCTATGSFPSASIGSYAYSTGVTTCMKRYCNENAQWGSIDYSECSCGGDMNSEWTFGYIGQTVYSTSMCQTGRVSGTCTVNGIENIDYSGCYCAADPLRGLPETVYGELAPTITCSSGTAQYRCGVNGKTTWVSVGINDCFCSDDTTLPGQSMFADVGSYYTATCGSGYAKFECLPTGVFGPGDYSNCKCSPQDGFSETLSLTTAEKNCPNDLSGNTKIFRQCLAGGVWESLDTVQSSCRCNAEGYYIGSSGSGEYLYPETSSGVTISVTCPTDSSFVVERTCEYDGYWSTTEGNLCPMFCPSDEVFGSARGVSNTDDANFAAHYTCNNGQTVLRWCMINEDQVSVSWSDANWIGCGCAQDALTEAVFYEENIPSASVSVTCGNGEDLTRTCSYGQWINIEYGSCQCAPIDDIYYSIPTDPNTLFDIDCYNGVKEAYCNALGQWATDRFIDTCSCPSIYYSDEFIVPQTPADTIYTVDCDEGYRTRECKNYGYWGSKFNNQNCKCKYEDQAYDLYYNLQVDCQKETTYYTTRCYENGKFGQIDAKNCYCYEDSFWEDYVALYTKEHTCSSNGNLRRECLLTGWSADITNTNCFCASTDFPDTNIGETAYVTCGESYMGQKSVVCLATGFFDEFIDDSQCVQYCPIDGDWPLTAPDTTAVITNCPNNLHGTLERYCQPNGEWSATVVTKCNYNSCPADDGFTSVLGGQIAYKDCVSGYSGKISRYCDYDGSWSVADDSQCTRITCIDEEDEALSGTTITKLCPTGYSGSIKKTCTLDGEFIVVNTCTLLMCPAIDGLIASMPYNTTTQVSCPSGYTGFQTLTCNSLGQWEQVHYECSVIIPSLSCTPNNEATDVARESYSNGIYTITCESNVPIQSVVNDNTENVNVFVTFTTEQTTLIYSTTSVKISDYVYAFNFVDNFPSNAVGYLFIQQYVFTGSYSSFPLAPMINKFYTIGGVPLAPNAINTDLIVINESNYEEGTVTVTVTVDFDFTYHQEAEITITGASIAPITFIGTTVVVSPLFLNVPVVLTWKVRNEYGWSESSVPSTYTPVGVPGQPGKPYVSDYVNEVVTWNWAASDEYGERIVSYKYTLYYIRRGNLVKQSEGTVTTTTLTLTLTTGIIVAIDVDACSASGCGPVSEVSDPHTIVSTLNPPTAVLNLAANAYSAQSVKVTWKAPSDTGGATIEGYSVLQYRNEELVYSTTTTSLNAVIEAEMNVAYTYTVYAYTSVGDGPSSSVEYTLPGYLETYNAYYSDGVITVAVKSSYNLLLSCTLVKRSSPSSFSTSKQTLVSARVLTKYSYSLLESDTIYDETCVIKEVKSGVSYTENYPHKTLKIADVIPVVNNHALTARGSFYTLYVSYEYAGVVSCFLDPADLDANDYSIFENKELYSCNMEHNVDGCSSEIITDGDGNSFDNDVTYNFYCYHERTVVVDNSPVTYRYPEESGSRRLLGNDEVFDIVAINPKQYSNTLNPDSSVVIEFSADVVASTGSITFLSNSSEEINLSASSKNVVCKGNECQITLSHGLLNNETYALSIEKTAFKSKSSNKYLEESVDNYIFSTGKKSCSPDYIVSGLEDSRLCQCYSTADKCECSCGSTSILRDL